MVEVEPGDVMFDVFVIVNVKVLVAALNSQVTEAVEAFPLPTPTTVMVSACAVAETTARMPTALNEKNNFRNRDIFPPCTLNPCTLLPKLKPDFSNAAATSRYADLQLVKAVLQLLSER